MRLPVRPLVVVGATPGAFRRIGIAPGGSFEGERLAGDILYPGTDWQSVRSDRSTKLDVRLVLKTNDGALIGMTYQGLRHGPVAVIDRLEKGEIVDPESYYFRINPLIETSAGKYDRLNRVIAVGAGHRVEGGAIYNVFEVL